MDFFHRGSFDGPWDAYGVYTDDYRIFIRDIGEDIPEIKDEKAYLDRWEMGCAMSRILSSALPSPTQSSSDRTIQTLLDIHTAVYGYHRHPSAEELRIKLRGPHSHEHNRYMEKLREDLTNAVRQGFIRVEALARKPWPFPDVESKEDERAPEVPVHEETTFIALRIVDQTGAPVSGARFELKGPDGRLHTGTVDHKGEKLVDGVVAGKYELTLPEVEERGWSLVE